MSRTRYYPVEVDIGNAIEAMEASLVLAKAEGLRYHAEKIELLLSKLKPHQRYIFGYNKHSVPFAYIK